MIGAFSVRGSTSVKRPKSVIEIENEDSNFSREVSYLRYNR